MTSTTIDNNVSTTCGIVSLYSDPMSFMLFNLTNVRAMLTLVFVFMMFNLTSMLELYMLVSEIVMIYILVLIKKLSILSTIDDFCVK
jgi:hypothetical protein